MGLLKMKGVYKPMNDYISIKEFAEICGVSTQSVYKRIRKPGNPIQPFVNQVDNQFIIKKSALKELYGIEVEKEVNKPGLEVDKPLINTTDTEEKINYEDKTEKEVNIIDLLNKQIEQLTKENDNKTKQIEQLNNSLNQALTNLDQQQKLSLVDKQRILELEEYKEKEESKTFWQRIFSKRNVEAKKNE